MKYEPSWGCLGSIRFEFGTEVGSCDTGSFVIVSKLAVSGGLAGGSSAPDISRVSGIVINGHTYALGG
jgi:hypothetical protein